MPIPLVIGIAAGLVGAGKTGKALYDNKKSSEANATAQGIAKRAERNLERSREQCQESLATLGAKKAETFTGVITSFITTFEKIKNIDFQHSGDLGNLIAKDFSNVVLAELKQELSFVIDSGLGIGGGALGGALTAFGAYNGTMMFATASTGTAISSFGGIAATNATLAWLGGGSLATGGMGIAGGVLALQALTAGPGLLIAGWYMGSKAKTKLNDAHSNIAKAKEFAADIDKAVALTNGIRAVADKATAIISTLCKHLSLNLNKLEEVIDTQGTDFSQYNDAAKMIVLRNVKILQVLKVAIDTPILDEQGRLFGSASAKLTQINFSIDNGFSKIENGPDSQLDIDHYRIALLTQLVALKNYKAGLKPQLCHQLSEEALKSKHTGIKINRTGIKSKRITQTE